MKADPRIKLIELQAASCPTGLFLSINKMYKELKEEQEESNYCLRQRIKNQEYLFVLFEHREFDDP